MCYVTKCDKSTLCSVVGQGLQTEFSSFGLLQKRVLLVRLRYLLWYYPFWFGIVWVTLLDYTIIIHHQCIRNTNWIGRFSLFLYCCMRMFDKDTGFSILVASWTPYILLCLSFILSLLHVWTNPVSTSFFITDTFLNPYKGRGLVSSAICAKRTKPVPTNVWSKWQPLKYIQPVLEESLKIIAYWHILQSFAPLSDCSHHKFHCSKLV